ncbi:MAG: recombination mediator RecR [Candidatus Kerfeldbacteria bacterium]
MKAIPPSIQRLVREFNKLPGIGSKTSERFVFHLLRRPKEDIELLAASLNTIKESIRLCRDCFTYTEDEICSVCSDTGRDRSIVCVVAEPKDVISVEKTGEHNGIYFVLGGLIDAAGGVAPEHLRISDLIECIDQNGITEIIIATNPTMEGETTALFIAEQLKDKPVTVSKIARGLPVGADIEFADEVTLGDALAGRRNIKE